MLKYKAFAALLLAAAMVPQSVYAYEAKEVKKEPVKAESTAVTTNEAGQKVLTLEAAMKLARDNSADLKNAEESYEIFQDNLSRTVTALNGSRPSPDIPAHELDPNEVSSFVALYNAQTQTKMKALQIALAKERAEYMALVYVLAEQKMENAVTTGEKQLALQRQSLAAQNISYSLGKISQHDLESAKATLIKAEGALETLQAQQAQNRLAFQNLLGLKEDFVVDYTPVYEPMKLEMSLDAYIDRAMTQSKNLKSMELSLDAAQYAMDNYVFTVEGGRQQTKYQYNEAARMVKSSKENFDGTVRSRYDAILAKETEIEELKVKQVLAEQKLQAGKTSLDLGKISQIAYETLELDAMSVAQSLETAVLDYIQLCYEFEHVDMIGGYAQAKSEQKD